MTHTIIPIKTSHAVAMCAVFFNLAKPVAKYKNVLDEIDFRPINNKDFKIETKKNTRRYEIVFQSEEIAYWKIILKGGMIGIECYEYTGWKDFCSFFDIVYLNLLKIIDEDIFTVGLCLIDNFTVDMSKDPKKDFAIAELFNKESSYITPYFFDVKHPPATSSLRFIDNVPDMDIAYKINKLSIAADAIKHGLKFEVIHEQASPIPKKYETICKTKKKYAYLILDKLKKNNENIMRNLFDINILPKIGL